MRGMTATAALCGLCLVASATAENAWEDPTLPVDERVAALLKEMTTAELVGQMRGHLPIPKADVYAGVGMSFMDVSKYPRAGAWREMQAAVMKESRFNIPLGFYHESLHGGCANATLYPMPGTLGASFNPELVHDIYSRVAAATRHCGATLAFAPVINMFKDPRFGRYSEGFSSNPTLTALYATAAAEGLQGTARARADAKGYYPPGKVAALAKHYLGYGRPEGGLNAARLAASEYEVREMYLPPWRAFAAAGGAGVMPSHQTVLDVPMHAHTYFLRNVLREEFGSPDMLTLSDCDDITVLKYFRMTTTDVESAALGANAGVDVDLQCGAAAYTPDNFAAAIAQNLTTDAVLREAAGRVLRVKFATGIYDDPFLNNTGSAVVDRDPAADRALAQRAAEDAFVLLKNNGKTLPLGLPNREGTRLAVMGFLASHNASQEQVGPYATYGARVTTLTDALTEAGVAYAYAKGAAPSEPADKGLIDEAVALATDPSTSTLVLMLGDDLKTCGEWKDRSNIDLPGGQYDLLDAVIAARTARALRKDVGALPPLVLVLAAARPTSFGVGNRQLEGVDAVLWVGRSGEAGGPAMWRVLSGATSPAGHLASQWVRSAEHIGSGGDIFETPVVGKWAKNNRSPEDPDGRVHDDYISDRTGPATPLFPFGWGLSYTTFKFGTLVADYDAATSTVAVSFTVTNTGGVRGAVAAQVYLVDPAHIGFVRPWKRFIGSAKPTLNPGASTAVTVTAGFDILALPTRDARMGAWTREVAPGTYTVRVGDSAAGDSLTAAFEVTS